MGSVTDSEEDDSNKISAYDPNIDSKNPNLKLGMIFRFKKGQIFYKSQCIVGGMMVKFVKNDKNRL